MTLQHAIKRVMNGDMLFVHTPAPPHEKFYFFASDFTTVPLPIGRRLRRLKGMATSPDGKRHFLAIRRSEARREHRPIFCDQARKSERADRGCWDYSSLAKTPVAARTEIF
jgi:hypothetical protein